MDSILIVDTYKTRLNDITEVLRKDQRSPDISNFFIDKQEPNQVELAQAAFAQKINDVLQEGKDAMVIMNYFSALQFDVWNILKDAEGRHGKGTRRILISCMANRKVNKNFGEDRKLIKHIRFDSDQNIHLEKLGALFLPKI